jgi:hypothetical protein
VQPLKLTDEQMDAVLRAAEPLHPVDRSPFLEALAAQLRGRDLGDGMVGRAIRDVQRKFFRPEPTEHPHKYARG